MTSFDIPRGVSVGVSGRLW